MQGIKPTHSKATTLVGIIALFTFFAILYSIACQISQSSIMHTIYGEADFIEIPFFAQDLIYHHGHFYDWAFPNSPYFFPDMFIIYLTTWVFKNFYVNNLLYSLFQIVFLIFIFGGIFKITTKTMEGFRLGIIASFSLLLLFVMTVHDNNGFSGYYIGLIVSAEHFGSLLMLLAALWIFLALLENENRWLLLLFFILVVASSISDLLFQLYFTVPMIGTLSIYCLLHKIKIRKYIQWTCLLFVFALISYVAYKIVPVPIVRPLTYIQLKYTDLIYFYHLILHDFFAVNIFVGVLWLLFLFWAPLSLLFKKSKQNTWIDFIILFFVLLILWAMLALLLLHKEGDTFQIRHLLPFIYGPVYLGLPLLLYKQFNGLPLLKNNYIYVGILLLFSLIALWGNPPLNIRNLVSYYPPHLMCMDRYAKRFHLHAGIGDYWQAKPFTQFNHSGFRVAAVLHDKFTPRIWINTVGVYRKDDFDFALINNKAGSPDLTFKRKDLVGRFGKPTHIFNCDPYTVYVYNNGAMRGLFPMSLIQQEEYQFPGWRHYEQRILSKITLLITNKK